jgi:phosphinothricin acetyltransferase
MSGSRNGASVSVRAATAIDLAAINDIYNAYVQCSHATFDLEPMSLATRATWFAGFDTTGAHQVVVASISGEVVGYAASSQLRSKPAYAVSVETSVYVAPDMERHGVGGALYGSLLRLIDEAGIHRTWAAIALPNDASVKLHERFGFEPAGVFREVGYKFDRYWDVAWYGRPRGAGQLREQGPEVRK